MPSATPAAQAGDWIELGSIGEDNEYQLLGFDDGYLAYSLEPASAWFAADGNAWQPVDLPLSTDPCVEDDEPYPDRIEAAATNGTAIVLLGVTSAAHPGTGRCALVSMAWTSSDGLSWQRSAPFGELRRIYFLDAPPPAVAWATADEFEALFCFASATYGEPPAEGAEQETHLWASADGLGWQYADADLPNEWARAAGAASADGTRILSLYETCPGVCVSDYLAQSALLSADDGVAWHDFEAPALGEDFVVTRVLGPTSYSPLWTLVAERVSDADQFERQSAIWTSPDLQAWQQHDVPAPRVVSLFSTSAGAIVRGCGLDWEECSTFRIGRTGGWTALAEDGVSWTAAADGPAGVIALGADGQAWRLAHD